MDEMKQGESVEKVGLLEGLKRRMRREMTAGVVEPAEVKKKVEEWAEVDKTMQLRAELKPCVAGWNDGGKEKYAEILDKSFLVAEYRRVRDARLSASEVANVVHLNELLKSRPELVREMTKGLIGVQIDMMKDMGVGGDDIRANEIHISGVVDLTGKMEKIRYDSEPIEQYPLAKIGAAVHDMVKYVGRPERNLLAEHETLLAAQEKALRAVFEELRKQPGMRELVSEQMVRSSITLLLKANAVHGEGEWPRNQTELMGKTVVLEDGLKVGDLFGGAHIFAETSKSMPVVLEAEADMISAEERKFLEAMMSGVSGADKLDGAKVTSIEKYVLNAASGSEFNESKYATMSELVMKLMYGSYADNLENIPNGMGLRSGEVGERIQYQSSLLISLLMDAACDPAPGVVYEYRSKVGREVIDNVGGENDLAEYWARSIPQKDTGRALYESAKLLGQMWREKNPDFRKQFSGIVRIVKELSLGDIEPSMESDLARIKNAIGNRRGGI